MAIERLELQDVRDWLPEFRRGQECAFLLQQMAVYLQAMCLVFAPLSYVPNPRPPPLPHINVASTPAMPTPFASRVAVAAGGGGCGRRAAPTVGGTE